MEIISMSEHEFLNYRKGEGKTASAIRIYTTEEEVKPLSKKRNEQFNETLYLYFSDVEKEIEEGGKIYRPFNKEDYEKVIEFYEKNKKVDELIVHCHAGVCRSPGIVEGLGKKYNEDFKHGMVGDASVYPYPNVISWFK